MVNIDDLVGVAINEVIAENLHIARHHHQFDAVSGERFEHLLLLLGLRLARHGKVKVWDPHVASDFGVIWMIRDNHSKVHWHFPAPPASEQVV